MVGIDVSKTNNDPKGLDKEDNQFDYISRTQNLLVSGVSDMISERQGDIIFLTNRKKRKYKF